jgi:hypothetical protein
MMSPSHTGFLVQTLASINITPPLCRLSTPFHAEALTLQDRVEEVQHHTGSMNLAQQQQSFVETLTTTRTTQQTSTAWIKETDRGKIEITTKWTCQQRTTSTETTTTTTQCLDVPSARDNNFIAANATKME